MFLVCAREAEALEAICLRLRARAATVALLGAAVEDSSYHAWFTHMLDVVVGGYVVDSEVRCVADKTHLYVVRESCI